jgi:hypothetical protein
MKAGKVAKSSLKAMEKALAEGIKVETSAAIIVGSLPDGKFACGIQCGPFNTQEEAESFADLLEKIMREKLVVNWRN